MDKDIYGRVADSRPLSRHKCDTIPLKAKRNRKGKNHTRNRKGVGGEGEGGEEGTKCSLPPVESD